MDQPAVYLDNAAATRPAAEVQACVSDAAARLFANPSAAHGAGAAAARALEEARATILAALGGPGDGVGGLGQLVFTSGGTEANALGILGAAARARGRHVVVTALEHPAVLRNAERLVQGGRDGQPGKTGKAGNMPETDRSADADRFELTVIPPARSGSVLAEAVAAAVRPDTALVAVMWVNNELGTVQPIAEIARALDARAAGSGGPSRRPHLHVDAVQAFGLVPQRAGTLGADSIAISAHKLHGPKGVGALWLRAGARVAPLWDGGRQERTLRSGTENVPGIVGFARAVTLAVQAQKSGAIDRMAALRDALEARILERVPGAFLTVTNLARAPHISSLAFPHLPAEPLLHALEARGVLAAAGSACASRTRGPSHVLKAIGIDDDTAVLRFSLSRDTTAAEIAHTVDAVAAAVTEIADVMALAKPRRTG